MITRGKCSLFPVLIFSSWYVRLKYFLCYYMHSCLDTCSGFKKLEEMFIQTTKELIPPHIVHLLYLQHHSSRPLLTVLVYLPPALVAMVI